VVTLYQGGLYHLYGYKRYTECACVRTRGRHRLLRGDPDNFTYPRYDFDVTISASTRTIALKVDTISGCRRREQGRDSCFTSGASWRDAAALHDGHLEVLRDTLHSARRSRCSKRRQANLKRYARPVLSQTRQVGDELFGLGKQPERALGASFGGLEEMPRRWPTKGLGRAGPAQGSGVGDPKLVRPSTARVGPTSRAAQRGMRSSVAAP